MSDIERKGGMSRKEFVILSTSATASYFAWRFRSKLPAFVHRHSPDFEELKPITPEKRKNGGVEVLCFGPFWQYDENPAQVAAASMERKNLVAGAKYEEIPVNYEKAVRQVETCVAGTSSNLVVILAVGGSGEETFIETSAGNRWPDPLPQGVVTDPYSISTKNMSIYPNERLNKVREASPLLTGRIQEFIDSNEWQNVNLADNGSVVENNSPCNAVLYALLRACEQNGKKECFLVHLPIDSGAISAATEKISALVEHLNESSDFNVLRYNLHTIG